MISRIFNKLKKGFLIIKYFFKTKKAIAESIAYKEEKLKKIYDGHKTISKATIQELDPTKVYLFVTENEKKEEQVKEAMEEVSKELQWSLPFTIVMSRSEVQQTVSAGTFKDLIKEVEKQAKK